MRKEIKQFGKYTGMLVLAAFLGCVGAENTMASGSDFIRGEWVNENLGPGAATWVDEHGNTTEPTHMKHLQEQTPELAPGLTGGPEAGGEQQTAEVIEQAPSTKPAETQTAETKPQKADVPAQSSGRTIDPNKPMIALTFDDGPYAPVGNQIMDCLAKYGGKATFFVVGNRCASYKTEMKRMAAEGHEIGNHTYDHKYLNKLNAEQIRYQISKGNEAIEATAGVKCRLVRLPGGNKNDTVLANVNAPMIMWNIDTEDWKTKNAQKTINAVVGKVKDGDIVLMHEIYKQSGAAAVDIIPALVNQGYQLVTVSELAQHRGGMENGKMYYRFRP